MECNVVRDLLPLYVDDCCSEESAKLVTEHLENCPDCRALYESMRTTTDIATVTCAPKKISRINDWKASVMQSVLLFISFAIITVGVALEAATPWGETNGRFAFSLVIPAAGFLLSLANWYFVRLYRSKKAFSRWSWLLTLGITLCAGIWALFHYEIDLLGYLVEFFAGFGELKGAGFLGVLSYVGHLLRWGVAFFVSRGGLLTLIFCLLSRRASGSYAAMLGKE